MKTKLENLELYSEEIEGRKRYYLKATYLEEDRCSIRRVTFPRIALPIADNYLLTHNSAPYITFNSTNISLGFGDLVLCYDKKIGGTHSIEEVKKKYTEMTLEEIEQKLGLNIKIISEQKDSQ